MSNGSTLPSPRMVVSRREKFNRNEISSFSDLILDRFVGDCADGELASWRTASTSSTSSEGFEVFAVLDDGIGLFALWADGTEVLPLMGNDTFPRSASTRFTLNLRWNSFVICARTSLGLPRRFFWPLTPGAGAEYSTNM